MDTAIPLGIIINELVSNSLKHAFSGRDEGEIRIKFYREKTRECINGIEESTNEDFRSDSFTLTVSDDGIGIPESLDGKILIVLAYSW
jgi:two-component sensor histidine kinase